MSSTTTDIYPTDHALIGASTNLPAPAPTPTISLSPISLSIPSRPVPLQLRLTLPATGTSLPIILLSHGHGSSNNLSSLNGYGPLVSFWASRGFAVIQPTHLSSKSLKLPSETAGAPLYWRQRVEDMKAILDHLDDIEQAAPFAQGRLDASKIAVAGHSLGGHTASMLLGMKTSDPENGGELTDLSEPRIKAGILMAVPGDGGEALSESGYNILPFQRKVDFGSMKTPALVVAGDDDGSAHLTVNGWKWHADPYRLGGGPKSLFTLFGGDHCLGGVSGWDAAETVNESPERVAAVQRLTYAYLKTVLFPGDSSWAEATKALEEIRLLGRVESKE